MEYSFIEIGNRIRDERIKNGLKNQEALIDRLSDIGIKVGRNKISAIENGTATAETFSIYLLTGLCKIFDCEIGYLLCEPGYENKTRVKTDICKETGLSEEAVSVLQSNIRSGIDTDSMIISKLLTSAIGTGLLTDYSTYIENPDNEPRHILDRETKANIIWNSISFAEYLNNELPNPNGILD